MLVSQDSGSTSVRSNHSITYDFEIKVLCAREILFKDGAQMLVRWQRGNQAASTNIKMLKNNSVYFLSKFAMSTNLTQKPGE